MRRLQNHLIILFLLTFFSVNAINGQIPALFNVTGSGSYCSGSSGLSISVSGSEVGVNYQLKNNGIPEGALVPGTGSALIWYNKNEGVYEVVAAMVSSGLSEKMNGKAIIIESPLPVVTFGYAYEKRLTIDADQVAGTQNLIDFPMLISIPTDNDLKSTGNGGKVQSNSGYDIAFTDENYNPIPFEKISYNPATGAYAAWVKVPLVSYNTDTDIHILYGKSGITTDPSSNETWSADYIQVMHLEGDLTDASLTGNYGLNDGTSISGGKLGSGRSFDGIDNKITVFDDPTLDGTNDEATFSLWINWVNSADGDYQVVMSSSNRYTLPNGGYEWASQGTGNHYFYPNGTSGSDYNLGPDPFTDNTWQYLAVTLNYNTKTVQIFVNGMPISLTTIDVPVSWTTLATIDDWIWGGNPINPSRYFKGSMDEIRVQTVSRSGDWLLTEYTNQNNPSGFYSLSAESSFEPLTDLCLDNPAYVLDLSKPAGGSYSGTGVSGGMFYPAIAGAGTHTIAYNYTDGNGCVTSGTKIQTVLMLPTPVISGNGSLPQNASGESYSTPFIAGNSCYWTISGAGATITGGQGTNEIIVNWGQSSGSLNVTETINATGCNSSSTEFNVTISDVTNPVIKCPGDLTVICNISEKPPYPNHSEFITAGGETSDNYALDPSSFFLLSEVSDWLTIPLTTYRTYSISDASGNSQTCTQKITILDNVSPILTCPASKTEYLNNSCEFILPDYTASISVIDNCDPFPVKTQSPVAGTVLTGAVTVQPITIYSVDAGGNSSQCIFSILLQDNTLPVLVCLRDSTIYIDRGMSSAQITLPAPGPSDNCGIQSVINDFNGGANASGIYPEGTTTVIYTVTDNSGNSVSCSQQITIRLRGDLLYNLIIPQGFSSNNDGLNDNFEIIGIEDYPDNELRIYNINGIEVYKKKNYDNTWEGSSSGKMSNNGKLPTGSYYYVINLGKDRVVKGYVYLIQE